MPTVTLAPANVAPANVAPANVAPANFVIGAVPASRLNPAGFAVPPAPPERPVPAFADRDPRDAAFLRACVRLARALKVRAGG